MLELLCLCLLVLWSPAEGGPLTDPHPNITDQELFWGSDQYEFSVVIPAKGLECFWHFAHLGEKFYLSYMVQWVTGVGHDRHLTVTINAPSGLLLTNIGDALGQADFEASETGFYQMCFSNFHNRFGSLQVFLSFGVYYEDDQDKPRGTEQRDKELNDTLSVIESATHRVEASVFHMFRYYSFGRMRKSADYYMLRSNSRYVSHWSLALTLLIVTSGYLQLAFLKSLFTSKAGTGEDKPRC
ncbi:transmembrane emp24 domain-containing protein 6 [Salarias fasciatus]|uniref:GOLD domain-containing protein n=1 Tax=Salarias fasciatus TaxID=181472 RepID=A0A672FMF8_SALFA|nr:transmembrane emp24 domain-containing protein 6 [Salarias fasciatus]